MTNRNNTIFNASDLTQAITTTLQPVTRMHASLTNYSHQLVDYYDSTCVCCERYIDKSIMTKINERYICNSCKNNSTKLYEVLERLQTSNLNLYGEKRVLEDENIDLKEQVNELMTMAGMRKAHKKIQIFQKYYDMMEDEWDDVDEEK